MDDKEIFLIEVGRQGRTGGNVATVDWTTIRADVDALLARPNISSLDAVPNVAAPSPANGQFLMWNGSAWVPATVSSGISLRAKNWDVVTPNMTVLIPGAGLTSEDEPSNTTHGYLAVNFAGSGSASTASRSDHAHTNPVPTRAPFGPQAYMSSGTRNLGSTSVVLPNGISCVVKSKINMQMRGADPGACYYQLRLTINGNARTSNGGSTGFWCVQGVPDKTTWEHHITLTGAGTAITISADCIYYGGGGFYTDAGEIVVEVDPDR